MPKVSVIIPVYNAEKYLRQCMESVVNQTLEDIEIICVDDGSTDGSLSILQEYEKNDDRVRVLTQKNQYAGVARNNGIAAASGEYYMFLDADDFFEATLLETLYEKGKKLNADVVLCGADRYDENAGEFSDMSWLLKERYIQKQPFNREKLPERIFQVTSLHPWNKMVSADFVAEHQLKFQALPRANDVYFTMIAIALAERIAAVNQVLVHYRVGMSGNLQSQNDKSPLSFCEALTAVRNRLETEGVLEQLWFSLAESALSQSVYNLKQLQGKIEAYQILANALRERYLNDFFVWRGIEEEKLDKTFTRELMELLDERRFPPLKETTDRVIPNNNVPCVSIIIPVYNVEKYLQECMDSVVCQTLQNIEIICIDDGSTDNSARVLEEYRKKDTRIQVITQENAGLSVARNTGMAQAHGEYIYFLDSDDYMEADTMELLYDVCRKNELDIVHFDFTQFYDDGIAGKSYNRKCKPYIYDGVSFLRQLKEKKMYTSVVWAQMYNRKFLKQNCLSFYPGIIHEDELFTFYTLMEAQRVAHVEKQLYHHRLRANSIMMAGKSAKNVMGYFVCMREIMIYGMREKYFPQKEQQIQRAFEGMRWNTRHVYAQISDEEKTKLIFDDPFSKMLFEKIVIENAVETSNEVVKVVSRNNSQTEQMLIIKNKMLDQEIRNIHASVSYKVGRFFTWLPRKVRGFLRCYQEHGAAYTWERILIHLRLRADPCKQVPTAELVVVAHKTSQEELDREEQYRKNLSVWYEKQTGKKLNLDYPVTFNEKIQWMKLYDSTPRKTLLADKYLMRNWVKQKFGNRYLIPLLGVWNSFDEIDFDKLPEKFALKTNHGSTWNIIVRDKNKLDRVDAEKKLTRWLATNFASVAGFELHYSNIPPKIIAEEYHPCQYEYQYWCFNGEAKFISAIHEPHGENTKATYDLNWNELEFVTSLPRLKEKLERPIVLEDMNRIAKKICKEFAFVRVDFLYDGKQLFVGEITFTPASGVCQWSPEKYDRIIGELLALPPKSPIPERQF